ncbi:MAG: hypothetical protein KAS32_24880 [Candidatus Peribacteraceae bacterium]|nr:hypothetical protein [Candidatus Peribacteraceae bacterium]
MTRECHNSDCPKHSKTEPFCYEEQCVENEITKGKCVDCINSCKECAVCCTYCQDPKSCMNDCEAHHDQRMRAYCRCDNSGCIYCSKETRFDCDHTICNVNDIECKRRLTKE